jgi:hypothetical protein
MMCRPVPLLLLRIQPGLAAGLESKSQRASGKGSVLPIMLYIDILERKPLLELPSLAPPIGAGRAACHRRKAHLIRLDPIVPFSQ